MKIRTSEELYDLISHEQAWRRKELTAIRSNIATSRKFAKNTSLRAGIALLYAHWEGLIKNIATYYLCYVSCKKLKYSDLKQNFLALSVYKNLELFSESKKASMHNKIINEMHELADKISDIPYENVIKTNSNLNSEIFIEIMETIGLDYSSYETNFVLIDEVLLKMRNEIAHGERAEELDLDEKRFFEIYDKMVEMMNRFANQVANASCTNEFKKL